MTAMPAELCCTASARCAEKGMGNKIVVIIVIVIITVIIIVIIIVIVMVRGKVLRHLFSGDKRDRGLGFRAADICGRRNSYTTSSAPYPFKEFLYHGIARRRQIFYNCARLSIYGA